MQPVRALTAVSGRLASFTSTATEGAEHGAIVPPRFSPHDTMTASVFDHKVAQMPLDALIALRTRGRSPARHQRRQLRRHIEAQTLSEVGRPLGGPAPGAADAGYEQWCRRCAGRRPWCRRTRRLDVGERPGLSGSRGGVTGLPPRTRGGSGWRWTVRRMLEIRGASGGGQRSGGVPGTKVQTRSGASRRADPARLLRTGPGSAIWGAEATQVDELLVALPVRGQARELLDCGRWTRRQPQRLPLVMGEHRRENRRGRTGADAAHQLCLGTRGFGHAGGAVWAVHTWAATTSTTPNA